MLKQAGQPLLGNKPLLEINADPSLMNKFEGMDARAPQLTNLSRMVFD